MDANSGPYQLFYADPKVNKNIKNGKSSGIDWNITHLEIGEKADFLSLEYWLDLNKENAVNYCRNYVKWLYFSICSAIFKSFQKFIC